MLDGPRHNVRVYTFGSLHVIEQTLRAFLLHGIPPAASSSFRQCTPKVDTWAVPSLGVIDSNHARSFRRLSQNFMIFPRVVSTAASGLRHALSAPSSSRQVANFRSTRTLFSVSSPLNEGQSQATQPDDKKNSFPTDTSYREFDRSHSSFPHLYQRVKKEKKKKHAF